MQDYSYLINLQKMSGYDRHYSGRRLKLITIPHGKSIKKNFLKMVPMLKN